MIIEYNYSEKSLTIKTPVNIKEAFDKIRETLPDREEWTMSMGIPEITVDWPYGQFPDVVPGPLTIPEKGWEILCNSNV